MHRPLRKTLTMTIYTVAGVFLSGIIFGTGVTYLLVRSLIREAEDIWFAAQRLKELNGKRGQKL